ncbi:MAG: hypothetical protein NT013_26455 [Planctomycetia bacterium]|nr:hypothetical protein [Planctomycetia bacterium]
MTSPSHKKLQTTLRSTLRIPTKGRRSGWSKLAAASCSGLLGLTIVFGGPSSTEAGVRELFTKPSGKDAAATAAASSKVATPIVKTSARKTIGSAKIGPARRPGSQLVAQNDDPLNRLRQRDPESRFRESVDGSNTAPVDATKSATTARRSQTTAFNENPLDDAAQPRSSVEPSPIQPPETRLAALDAPQPSDGEVPEPVTSPAHLKKISDIQPFYDYHPATAIKGEVCWNLCPRPDGQSCQADENGNVPECPNEFKLGEEAYVSRPMNDCLYQWRASDQWHNPLYFEDPALERYGHTHHELLQPAVSIARFGVQFAGLPYQMAIDPVCKKMYTLGYYRPGECAPKKYYQIPWNTHAAATEAAAWTGLFFIFP